MRPLKPLATFIFCGLLAVFTVRAYAETSACIDWPRVMAQYELDHAPGGNAILIEPFTDYTKKGGDEWLETGIRDYIADLLKTGTNLRVLAGNTAIYGPQIGNIDYTVSGKFEHLAETLRVFISLRKQDSGELVRQFGITFPYPGNRDFFTQLAGAATRVLDFLKVKKDASAFERVRDATSSTSAYENYSRGRRAFESFSPAKAETTAQFFTGAKREDYRSPLGYMGIIGLYSFLGFYHKQQGDPYSSYFQRAEEELNEMKKLTGRDPVISSSAGSKKTKKRADEKINNRLIAGDIAFREGSRAFKANDWKRAAEKFRRSVEIVPEDAVSWYHLSRVYTALGDPAKAAEAMQKALGINSCIEGSL